MTDHALAVRVQRLEAVTRELLEEVKRARDERDRILRENRDLRARIQQLDDRDRWVDAFRADERDPYASLGKPARDRAGAAQRTTGTDR